jgi:hypothetical protein
MHNDPQTFRPSFFARRSAAVAFFAGVSALGLSAQQAAPAGAAATKLVLPAVPSFDASQVEGLSYSSSSSSVADAAAVESATLDFKGGLPEDATQPPPRRRYGNRRYNDSSHNPDGSNKYGFVIGVGAAVPISDTRNSLTTSYAFQAGGGRNFNKSASIFLQFDYDHFGFTGQTLANQASLYTFLSGESFAGLDGSSHVWSITANPIYNVSKREGGGLYVTGGGGFYHKTANFTVPATGEYCDFYGCYQYQANQTIDKYTSNAFGLNGGVGYTYKFSRFANEKFFVEARYQYMFNQQKPGITLANENSVTATSTNFYPANSLRTSWIPVKVGIRF